MSVIGYADAFSRSAPFSEWLILPLLIAEISGQALISPIGFMALTYAICMEIYAMRTERSELKRVKNHIIWFSAAISGLLGTTISLIQRYTEPTYHYGFWLSLPGVTIVGVIVGFIVGIIARRFFKKPSISELGLT